MYRGHLPYYYQYPYYSEETDGYSYSNQEQMYEEEDEDRQFGPGFPPIGRPPGGRQPRPRPPFSQPGPGPGPGQQGPGQGPAGGPPTSPPPSFVPTQTQQQVGTFAVDPGSIRGCLFRFTFIWLRGFQQFWFFPIFVGRRSIAGWRWTGFRWVYFGIDLRQIESFTCF